MSFAANVAAGNVPPQNRHDVTLDQIVQEITTTDDAKVLNDKLRHLSPRESRDTILSGALTGGQDPLSVLDPERNTIGCLYILAARLHATPAQAPSMRVVEEFCSRFTPEHARLAPERVTQLTKGIIRLAESYGKQKHALGALRDLVTRYPPDLSYLTTVHTQFISHCVATRHFSIALPVLSVPIVNIDTNLSELTYNDNLIYHYAGGIALGALKMWREAEEFFEICVSAPAQVPAAIQMEALKKLTLVQLILYGKTTSLPKYTNQALGRLFRQTPYFRLADMYPRPQPDLQAFVVKETEVFNRDQNSGLVQQVLDCAPRWLIRKATQTYLTLGMSDIAKETGNPNVNENRSIVLSMIDNGEINGTLSEDDTVTFSETTTNITKNDIDKALKNAQEQSSLLLRLERELYASREYLVKVLKHKDDGNWAQDDDSVMGMPHLGGSNAWADDSMFG
ncbi:hypothetical protein BXZ70DRAFT_963485 [Cristinia sonorae]|uniref:COP9 signalosome complex subunit 3 n=1 Tax=Cristinia sonorae TaxID=1940300 RepID=A0A8K0XJV6_9AGAR|nr:hypothetical protein BXZ70DRAFT_963485 [Cristinia sonorae]